MCKPPRTLLFDIAAIQALCPKEGGRKSVMPSLFRPIVHIIISYCEAFCKRVFKIRIHFFTVFYKNSPIVLYIPASKKISASSFCLISPR